MLKQLVLAGSGQETPSVYVNAKRVESGSDGKQWTRSRTIKSHYTAHNQQRSTTKYRYT